MLTGQSLKNITEKQMQDLKNLAQSDCDMFYVQCLQKLNNSAWQWRIKTSGRVGEVGL